MLFCCRKKQSHEDPPIDVSSLAITLNEVRVQQAELLRQVSTEDFNNRLCQMIQTDIQSVIEEVVSKKVISLKTHILNQIENQVLQSEFKIVSKVSGDVEKKVDKIIREYIQLTEIELKRKLQTIVQEYESRLSLPENPISQQPSIESLPENTRRYMQYFNKTDTMFWGIGIENETYLELDPIIISGEKILKQLGRERYSVDYTKNYDIKAVKEVMRRVYDEKKNYQVSRMVNSHALSKTDRKGENRTLYTKDTKINPKFSGKSILEEWFEYDLEVQQKIHPSDKTLTNVFFDGDTIEFITENFYNTDTFKVSQELILNRQWFLSRFRKFKEDTGLWPHIQTVDFVREHPGLNTFITQSDRIVLFNNTTIHVHLTLPTPIKDGVIIDQLQFTKVHKNAIRMIQWFEPFFIATLGSPDLFNQFEGEGYSGGSMRTTLSRYIGIGTYNTDKMEEKKILTKPITEVRPVGTWWRDLVEKEMRYILPTDEIGLDFNYAKYYQSGLEFRILDGFPMEILKDVLDVILLICEHSLHLEKVQNPISIETWNQIVYRTMRDGCATKVNRDEMLFLAQALRIPIIINETEIKLEEFYYTLLESVFKMYPITDSIALKHMSKNFERVNRWENFNQKQTECHRESMREII